MSGYQVDIALETASVRGFVSTSLSRLNHLIHTSYSDETNDDRLIWSWGFKSKKYILNVTPIVICKSKLMPVSVWWLSWQSLVIAAILYMDIGVQPFVFMKSESIFMNIYEKVVLRGHDVRAGVLHLVYIIKPYDFILFARIWTVICSIFNSEFRMLFQWRHWVQDLQLAYASGVLTSWPV